MSLLLAVAVWAAFVSPFEQNIEKYEIVSYKLLAIFYMCIWLMFSLIHRRLERTQKIIHTHFAVWFEKLNRNSFPSIGCVRIGKISLFDSMIGVNMRVHSGPKRTYE